MIIDHITKTFNEYWYILLLLFFSMLLLTILMSRTAKLVEDVIGHDKIFIFHKIGFSFLYAGIFIITGCFLWYENLTDGIIIGVIISLLVRLFIFDIDMRKYDDEISIGGFFISSIVASAIFGGVIGFISSCIINTIVYNLMFETFSQKYSGIIIKIFIMVGIVILFYNYFKEIYIRIESELEYLSFSKILATIICYFIAPLLSFLIKTHIDDSFEILKQVDEEERDYVINILSLLIGFQTSILIDYSIDLLSSVYILLAIVIVSLRIMFSLNNEPNILHFIAFIPYILIALLNLLLLILIIKFLGFCIIFFLQ